MGFTVKRVLRRVLRRGSEKGVSRRCLERPLEEYAPSGVHPAETKCLRRCHHHHIKGPPKSKCTKSLSCACC